MRSASVDAAASLAFSLRSRIACPIRAPTTNARAPITMLTTMVVAIVTFLSKYAHQCDHRNKPVKVSYQFLNPMIGVGLICCQTNGVTGKPLGLDFYPFSFVSTAPVGQRDSSGQIGQAGARAVQVWRPWRMRRMWKP